MRMRTATLICVLTIAIAGPSSQAHAQTAYCWIDAATGKQVPTAPASGANQGPTHSPDDPGDAKFDPSNPNRASDTRTGKTFIRVPCPPTDASTTPPTHSSILPGGVMLPGKDKGDDTSDKRDGDSKTTDTKPTDSKTPGAPVKDGKPQQADAPKTGQPAKTVTGKDDKPSKGTAEKVNPKGTKDVTGPANGSKTATAPKTTKTTAAKPKEKKPEEKAQFHIEFFSTRSGGGGFGTGGFGR